jgi:hypothetical protein
MIAEGDVRGLRNRALKAAVFAACTAHTGVGQAEREYTEWAETGSFPVDGTNNAEQKASAAITADAYIETLELDDFRVDGWTFARGLAANVYGLGAAKASFAAALMGYPEPYCLDTHCLALIAGRIGERVELMRGRIGHAGTRAATAWRWYRHYGDTTFGTRDHQWEYFALAVPAFAEGGHEAYFTTVL